MYFKRPPPPDTRPPTLCLVTFPDVVSYGTMEENSSGLYVLAEILYWSSTNLEYRMIIWDNHCQIITYDLQFKLENGDTQKCIFVYYRSIYQNDIFVWLLIVYSLTVTIFTNYCYVQKLNSLHARTQKHTHTVYVCFSINSRNKQCHSLNKMNKYLLIIRSRTTFSEK